MDADRVARLAALADEIPEVRKLLEEAEAEAGKPFEPEWPRIPERVEVQLCPEHFLPIRARVDREGVLRDWCGSEPYGGGHAVERPVTQAYALPVVYPRVDGSHIVLGPEVFASADSGVLRWRGENYVSQKRLRHHLVEVLSAAGLMATQEGRADGA
jgi:hypothetical protein